MYVTRRTSKCRLMALLLGVLFVCNFTSCQVPLSKTEELISQKKTESTRTQITVLVKHAFSVNGFEKIVEEKFPDIDLVQVGNYTRDMGTAEYEARLEHHDLTDIVMTWPMDVGEKYLEENLMDLSGMSFTTKYNIGMLNKISKNGKLFYIPGPAQIRGILYNKTLFQEKGWEVPSSFNEFIELCQTIEQSGIRSIQLGFANSEVLDTAFVGYNFGKQFSTPQDMQWIEEYNNGQHSFGDHFSEALDVFQYMIDVGIWKPEDLQVSYSDREKMIFSRQCAMIEDSVLMAKQGGKITGTTDTFALMPFFNPGEENEWARLYMVCYIGLNKQLAEPDQAEKYKKVQKIMEFISTEEGQNALMVDNGAMFSSLTGTIQPQVPEIEDISDSLTKGRYAVFPTLKNAQQALREGLAGMVAGTHTPQQVIEMVDAQNKNPPEKQMPTKLGEATEDFSLVETGSFVTDVLREKTGCEIALFLDNGMDGRENGKGISGKFYAGDITDVDIKRVLPDLKYGDEGTLCKVNINGADLINVLEYAVEIENNVTGWFYYFSGIKMQYDPTAAPGKRIHSITTADGKPLDKQKVYSVATMHNTISEEYFADHENTAETIEEILFKAIQEKGKISPPKDERFLYQ